MIIREKCTGCGACKSVCPFGAITMIPDKGGFLYPEINSEKCHHCGLCDTVCEQVNSANFYKPQRIIGLKHNNKTVRSKSTSGGAFYLLASAVIEQGGIVYGAAYNTDWTVHHLRCTTLEDVAKLQKSKYVQSDLEESYLNVVRDLTEGKQVLFSGTACQCSGIINVLKLKKINTDRLITCDLICHGVPSPAVWKDYLQDRSKKGKITGVDFRDKKHGWRDSRVSLTYDCDGKIVKKTYRQNEDYFMVLFSHDYTLREACYNCKYARNKRISDFTIGDFWGVEKFAPQFSDDKGISVVAVNSKKAARFMSPLLKQVSYIESDIAQITLRQTNLCHPTKKNPRYDNFWKDYQTNGYQYVIRKYADATFWGTVKRKYIFKFLHYTGIFDLLLTLRSKIRQWRNVKSDGEKKI